MKEQYRIQAEPVCSTREIIRAVSPEIQILHLLPARLDPPVLPDDQGDEKYGSGWTGYTWNRELFPDPAGFLRWLHERSLHVTLNVHPITA